MQNELQNHIDYGRPKPHEIEKGAPHGYPSYLHTEEAWDNDWNKPDISFPQRPPGKQYAQVDLLTPCQAFWPPLFPPVSGTR